MYDMECSYPKCFSMDPLCSKCKKCFKYFCRDHIMYNQHACTIIDRTIPTCPLYSSLIEIPYSEELDQFSSLNGITTHIENSCTRTYSKYSNLPEIGLHPCCVLNCKEAVLTVQCDGCMKYCCIYHRFPKSHECRHYIRNLKKNQSKKQVQSEVLNRSASDTNLLNLTIENTLKTADSNNIVIYCLCYYSIKTKFKPAYFTFKQHELVGKIIDTVCNYHSIKNNAYNDPIKYNLFLLDIPSPLHPSKPLLEQVKDIPMSSRIESIKQIFFPKKYIKMSFIVLLDKANNAPEYFSVSTFTKSKVNCIIQ